MRAHDSYIELSDVSLAEENDKKLAKIQERHARLEKINQIRRKEEETHSAAWYLNVWNYCVGPITVAVQGLKTVMSFLSPVAVGLSWLHTLHSVKRLYENKNRTLADYGKTFFSFAAAGISTALLIAGTAAMSPALPFLAIGTFAAFAAYGIFNFAKNIYRAVKTRDKEERKEYLKQAGKQLIGIVVNTLAIAATVIFGIKMSDAVSKLNNAIDRAKECFAQYDFARASEWGRAATELGDACMKYAEQGAKVLIALTSFVALGVGISAAKMNKTTLDYLRHPTKIWYELKANPLSAIRMIVMAPIRLAALVVVAPIQGLLFGLGKIAGGLKKLFTRQAKQEEPVQVVMLHDPAKKESKLDTDKRIQLSAIDQVIQNKRDALDKQYPAIEHAPKEIQARRFQLGKMHHFVNELAGGNKEVGGKSYQSVAEIESDAKKISPNMYGTFFRKVDDVKQIADEVRSLTPAL